MGLFVYIFLSPARFGGLDKGIVMWYRRPAAARAAENPGVLKDITHTTSIRHTHMI